MATQSRSQLRFVDRKAYDEFWTVLPQPTRFLVSYIALRTAPPAYVLVTSVVRKSPSHEGGHAVDITFRRGDKSDPVLYGISPRYTTSFILHAVIRLMREDAVKMMPAVNGVYIYFENDHLHIDDLPRPENYQDASGVYVYDNPRPTYPSEARLLRNPRLLGAYKPQIRTIVKG